MSHNLGQRVIAQRRRQEEKARAMEAAIADEVNAMQKATFEVQTTKKLEKRTKQEQYEEMKRQQNIALLERKQRLADLYNYEMEMWKSEVINKVETVEDRKARIMEKAYALRDAREKARLEYVEKCYNQQWRDACDDARTLDSKAMVSKMNRDRLAQIADRRKHNEYLSQQETNWINDWKKQLDEMGERDRMKDELRHQAAKDTMHGLKAQMDSNLHRKVEHMERTLQEDEEEIQNIRAAIAEEDRIQRERLENAHARGREVLAFNAQYKELREEEERTQREQDAMLLQYALRKEREAAEEEEAKRQANKEASLRYRKYLEEMMIKDAQDDSWADEVRKKEEEKVFKARDDALEARRQAREHLMKMVDEGRQSQIAQRREQIINEREEERIRAARFIEDAREGMEKERAEAQRRREQNIDNNKLLQEQIAMRRHKEELEKQEEYLADKHMQRIEKLHKQRLAEQAGVVRDSFVRTRSNWYT